MKSYELPFNYFLLSPLYFSVRIYALKCILFISACSFSRSNFDLCTALNKSPKYEQRMWIWGRACMAMDTFKRFCLEFNSIRSHHCRRKCFLISSSILGFKIQLFQFILVCLRFFFSGTIWSRYQWLSAFEFFTKCSALNTFDSLCCCCPCSSFLNFRFVFIGIHCSQERDERKREMRVSNVMRPP